MPKGDHCSVWGCDNDRRYPERMVKMDHVHKIKFFRCQNVKKVKVWKRLISRTDVSFKKLKGSPCVCSNHFIDGHPTTDNPDPTIYLKGYTGISREAKKERRRLVRRSFGEVSDSCSKKARDTEVSNNGHSDHQVVNCQIIETTVSSENNGADENDFCMLNDDHVEHESEVVCPAPYEDHNHYVMSDNNECARTRTCIKSSDNHLDIATDLRNKILKLEQQLRKREEEIEKLKQKLTKSFSIDDIKGDDPLVETYTGIQNFQVYKFLLNKIEPKAKKLHYYRGKRSHKLKNYQSVAGKKKPGKKRTTSISTEFFLTLCRLRQNLSEEDLSYRFKISVSTVSTILSTWIPFLGKELVSLIQWPKLKEIGNFYPTAFRPFPNVCSIIDCTEIYIQRPSLAEAQALTYSTYKSHNTAKYLLSITPSGVISFVSRGYGGLSSDRFVFNDCGVVEKFERGSSCMVDRGFVVQDLLLSRGVKVFMPPFTKGQKQFTKEKVTEGQAIAKARIHVERAIQRVKHFRIFQSVLPLTLKDSLDNIVLICSALTNLLPPLIANC